MSDTATAAEATTQTATQIPADQSSVSKMGSRLSSLLGEWSSEQQAQAKAKETPAPAPAQAQQPKPETAKEAPKKESIKDSLTNAAKPAEQAAPKAEENDYPENVKSEKSRQSWDTMREKAKKVDGLEKELNTLKAQLTKSGQNAAETEAVKKLQEENSDLQKRLQAVSLERDPKFANYYNGQTKQQIDLAKSVVPAEHHKALEQLMTQSRSESAKEKLEQIAEGLHAVDRGIFYQALSKIEQLRIEKEEALNNSSENFRKLQDHYAAENAKSEAQQNAKLSEMAEEAVTRAGNLDVFKEIEGDDAHNSGIKDRQQFVREFLLGKADPETYQIVPGLALEAAHLKSLVVPKLQQEIANLRETVQRLQGAAPEGGRTEPKAPAAEEKPKVERGVFSKIFQKNLGG